MNFTIALLVSLFCGLIWAQDHTTLSVPDDDGMPNTNATEGDLTEEFLTMKEKLMELETRLDEGEEKLMALETGLDKAIYTVAFTATIGGEGTSIGPNNVDTTLVFKAVKTNIGNVYNPSTGVFVAPVSGLYYFTLFYHAGGERPVHLSLMKNNQRVVFTADNRVYDDTADNGGNAAFLELKQGDHVFVRLAAHTHVWGDDGRTTFSGSLVRQY